MSERENTRSDPQGLTPLQRGPLVGAAHRSASGERKRLSEGSDPTGLTSA